MPSKTDQGREQIPGVKHHKQRHPLATPIVEASRSSNIAATALAKQRMENGISSKETNVDNELLMNRAKVEKLTAKHARLMAEREEDRKEHAKMQALLELIRHMQTKVDKENERKLIDAMGALSVPRRTTAEMSATLTATIGQCGKIIYVVDHGATKYFRALSSLKTAIDKEHGDRR